MRTEKPNFHPGSYLQDILEEYGFRQLVKDTGLDQAILLDLLSKKQNITMAIALKLEQGTKVSAGTWLNLQEAFDKGEIDE